MTAGRSLAARRPQPGRSRIKHSAASSDDVVFRLIAVPPCKQNAPGYTRRIGSIGMGGCPVDRQPADISWRHYSAFRRACQGDAARRRGRFLGTAGLRLSAREKREPLPCADKTVIERALVIVL